MKFALEEISMKAAKACLDGKVTSKKLAEIFGDTSGNMCTWVRAYKEHNQLAAKPNEHRKMLRASIPE